MTSKELEKVLLSEVSLNNILESVNVFIQELRRPKRQWIIWNLN